MVFVAMAGVWAARPGAGMTVVREGAGEATIVIAREAVGAPAERTMAGL